MIAAAPVTVAIPTFSTGMKLEVRITQHAHFRTVESFHFDFLATRGSV